MLREKKYAKMKKQLLESDEMSERDTENQRSSCEAEARSEMERPTQVAFWILFQKFDKIVGGWKF